MSQRQPSAFRALRAIVARQMRLSRGGNASNDLVVDWHTELEAVGCDDPERLDAAFRAARQYRHDHQARGPMQPEDVVAAYRGRAVPAGAERSVDGEVDEVPNDPLCSWGCRSGEVEMTDPEGYEIVVPCSCRAGEYIRRSRRVYEGKRNVKELRMAGYTVVQAAGPPSWMSDAQAEWVAKQGALSESGGGGRPYLTAVQMVADKNGVQWPPRTTRRMPGSEPREVLP